MGKLGTLSIICILFTMLTSSCGSERTNRERPRGQGEAAGAVETPEFAPARAVLEAKCMSCHDNWKVFSESDYFQSENEVTFEPLVKKGDRNSILLRSLKNNGGTMPKNRAAISATDLGKIQAWVDSLK